MKIALMGTPEIAKTVLAALLNTQHEVVFVVTQPDKPQGRKRILTPSPVKILAQEKGIQVYQPKHLKEDHDFLLNQPLDLIVTIAYGQLVPQVVLEAPKYGCVNLHGSLLPAYRGAAPIQRAIWDGLSETGMSLMYMAAKMDAGDVIAQNKVIIEPDDTTTILFEKMAQAASQLLLEQLDKIDNWQATAQDESQVTYAKKITKEDEILDLTKSDLAIYQQYRALTDFPGATLRLDGQDYKLLACYYEPGQPTKAYVVANRHDALVLNLQEGSLVCTKIKPAGKKEMDAKSFMNGAGRQLIGLALR